MALQYEVNLCTEFILLCGAVGCRNETAKQNNNQSGVRELNLHRFFYYHKSTSKERSDFAAKKINRRRRYLHSSFETLFVRSPNIHISVMNLFKIKIKNTTYGVSFSFFFVIALMTICSATQTEKLLMTLVSCALHELGHLVLMTAFGSSPQEIVVYGGGIRITPDNKQLSKYHELAVLFAGPVVNFVLCLLTYLTNGGGFFCQVNFLLGALNLMPFRYFDGGRILALLANGKVCEFFRVVFILLSAVAMIHMILHGTVSISFVATFCFIVLSEVIY